MLKYRMTESMTALHDHDGLSRGPSTRTRFDRFSAIRVLLLLVFLFFINSLKKHIVSIVEYEQRSTYSIIIVHEIQNILMEDHHTVYQFLTTRCIENIDKVRRGNTPIAETFIKMRRS